MTAPIDTAALRAVAEAAMAGSVSVNRLSLRYVQFAEAVDPPTVIALLDEIDALRDQLFIAEGTAAEASNSAVEMVLAAIRAASPAVAGSPDEGEG